MSWESKLCFHAKYISSFAIIYFSVDMSGKVPSAVSLLVNLQKVMCAALVTDVSVLVLKVSICLPCFKIVIQKQLGF